MDAIDVFITAGVFVVGIILGAMINDRPLTGQDYKTCSIYKQSGEVCELNVEYIARKVED